MCTELKRLINQKIQRVEKVYVNNEFDFWGIDTENCSIGIYNAVKVGFNARETIDLLEIDEQLLVSHFIIEIQEIDGEFVVFKLDNNQNIYISIKEDDFSGPEAGVFHFVDGTIIVLQEE